MSRAPPSAASGRGRLDALLFRHGLERAASTSASTERPLRRRSSTAGNRAPTGSISSAISPSMLGCDELLSLLLFGDLFERAGLQHPLRLEERELRHLRLALDVDLPAGEPSGQPGVLPFPADGEGELVIGNDRAGGLFGLIGVDPYDA